MSIKNLLDIHIPEWRNMNREELLTALDDCDNLISLLCRKFNKRLRMCYYRFNNSGLSRQYKCDSMQENLLWYNHGYAKLIETSIELRYIHSSIKNQPELSVDQIIHKCNTNQLDYI